MSRSHSNRKQNAVRSGHAGHVRRLITCFDGGYPPGRRQYPARQEEWRFPISTGWSVKKDYMQLPIDEVYTGKQKNKPASSRRWLVSSLPVWEWPWPVGIKAMRALILICRRWAMASRKPMLSTLCLFSRGGEQVQILGHDAVLDGADGSGLQPRPQRRPAPAAGPVQPACAGRRTRQRWWPPGWWRYSSPFWWR